MNYDTSAKDHLPPAVVAGAFQTGVLGVRSLLRRGVRAVCFDSNPANAGFTSVYGPARLSPDSDSQPAAWVDFMLGLADSLGERAVLIPSSDKFVSAIAAHADTLRDHYLFSPSIAQQALLTDKHTQYALAAQHGMPLPKTQYVTSVTDVDEFAHSASFPCLIKPLHFREWQRFPTNHALFDRKIVICRTRDEMLANYRLAAAINSHLILQEIIAGDDTAKRVYLGCYDTSGKRLAHAMFRELRCHPMGFGPASVTEPVVDDEVDEICDDFLRRIGYTGICEIEIKRDARDGKPKLIEANPRLSGSGDAAPYAGVDLCWIHYQDLIGRTVEPVAPNGKHFKHIVLRADANAVPAYRHAGLLSWKDVFRSYRPPLAFFDLDARDWRNSIETLLICARLLVRGLLRRPPASHQ